MKNDHQKPNGILEQNHKDTLDDNNVLKKGKENTSIALEEKNTKLSNKNKIA